MTYIIRPITLDEIRLVMSSWLESLASDRRHHGRNNGKDRAWCTCARCRLLCGIKDEVYFAGERDRANWLLTEHGAKAATLPEVPDEVLGWACIGNGALHYGYVKPPYRGQGVMKALLVEANLVPGPLTVSTLTHDIERWMFGTVPRDVRYNPYAGQLTPPRV